MGRLRLTGRLNTVSDCTSNRYLPMVHLVLILTGMVKVWELTADYDQTQHVFLFIACNASLEDMTDTNTYVSMMDMTENERHIYIYFIVQLLLRMAGGWWLTGRLNTVSNYTTSVHLTMIQLVHIGMAFFQLFSINYTS